VVNDLGGSVSGEGASTGPAQQVVDEIVAAGGEAVANTDDISDYDGAGRLIQTAVDTFGRLDAVVCNAGILRDRMLVNMTVDEWDAVIRVHLRGTFCPVRHAAEYWREAYVAVPAEGLTLEGYVDLVYRPQGSDGLVVVDYKTDVIRDDSMLADRMAHYRVQGAAYAIAVSTATGEPVDRCVFLFLAHGAAREIEVAGDELAAAIAQVRTLTRSVRDHPPAYEPVVLADA